MYIDDLGKVAEVVLTEFFRDFQVARDQVATGRPQKSLKNIPFDEWVSTASTADLLTDVALAGGSSKKSLVEVLHRYSNVSYLITELQRALKWLFRF